MNIRIALTAMAGLLAITLPAAAQQQTHSLTLTQVATAAQTANPELASLALQRGTRASRSTVPRRPRMRAWTRRSRHCSGSGRNSTSDRGRSASCWP